MCFGFFSSLYAAIQMTYIAFFVSNKCTRKHLLLFSAMRLTEAILWWSIEYQNETQNRFISSWILPLVFSLLLFFNYKCTQTQLPVWWPFLLVFLVSGCFYFFYDTITITRPREWFRGTDWQPLTTRQLILGNSALPSLFSTLMSIFIYRPQSSDPSTLHWLFHSSFLIIAVSSTLSDYAIPTLCACSVVHSWALLP